MKTDHLSQSTFSQGKSLSPTQTDDLTDQKKVKPLTGDADFRVILDFAISSKDLIMGKLLYKSTYAEVHEGKWEHNPVAIKQYFAEDASEQTNQEICKEGFIMATVSSQSHYLVQLRGIILEEPRYSLVMEYMPGGSLSQLLKSSQEMTWPMRYRIALDMTIGLSHLHRHGFLHRDLKSGNVLLDMNFRAKLADFNISKKMSEVTLEKEFKGTARWAAPELLMLPLPVAKANAATDIYSLGMVLWELTSRAVPFKEASNTIALAWVMQGRQETVPEETPEDFKALILSCWNKDQAKRPKADAVVKQLDSLWQTEQKKTTVLTESPSSEEEKKQLKLEIAQSKDINDELRGWLDYERDTRNGLLQELDKEKENNKKLQEQLDQQKKIRKKFQALFTDRLDKERANIQKLQEQLDQERARRAPPPPPTSQNYYTITAPSRSATKPRVTRSIPLENCRGNCVIA